MLFRMKAATALALFTGLVLCAQEKKPADQPFDDTVFVKTAASAGLHEVELGKLAQTQAKNDAVKKFAEILVKDHTKSNEELKAAAKAAGIEVPDKMNETHQKHVDMFKNYKGDNFDRDFIKHEITDHTESIALFTRASKEAKNKELKDFATKTLPTLEGHLAAAKKLDANNK